MLIRDQCAAHINEGGVDVVRAELLVMPQSHTSSFIWKAVHMNMYHLLSLVEDDMTNHSNRCLETTQQEKQAVIFKI